jgi:hypothetical protein
MNSKTAFIAVGVAALLGMGALAAGKGVQILTTKPAELQWRDAVPGVPPGEGPQSAIVWGDPVKGPVAMFLKVPAGSHSGVHMHSGDYRGVVLQGTITDSETDDPSAQSLPAGSYYFQPGKSWHNNVCRSAEPCLLYIEFPNSGIDFTPKDRPVSKK